MNNLNKTINNAFKFILVGLIASPATVKVTPKQVSLENQMISKYFTRDSKGKISFVFPAPVMKLMTAKAAVSCGSSSSSSDSESESSSSSSTNLDACEEKWDSYQSGALGFYHNALCRLNNGYTASAEKAMCEFANVLGVDTSFSNLPIDVSDTFDLGIASYKLELKAEVPTEEFATTLGYTVKATLLVNDAQYMVIYWDGSSAGSKGFLIENSQGFMDKQGSYIQWDLSDADNQQVKVMAATMSNGSFMAPLQAGFSGSGRSSDTALYGSVNFDNSSGETVMQYVEIKAERSMWGNSIGCFKVYADGIKDGTLQIARSSNMHGGGSVSDSAKDSTGMVGVSLTDSVDTTDSEAVAISSADLANLVEFDKSCNDVRKANLSSKPFHNNKVNFSAAPSDIF